MSKAGDPEHHERQGEDQDWQQTAINIDFLDDADNEVAPGNADQAANDHFA